MLLSRQKAPLPGLSGSGAYQGAGCGPAGRLQRIVFGFGSGLGCGPGSGFIPGRGACAMCLPLRHVPAAAPQGLAARGTATRDTATRGARPMGMNAAAGAGAVR